MHRISVWLLLFAFHLGTSAHAQTPLENAPDLARRDPRLLDWGELDILLGPIALYPDPLLAILLPAATEPVDVVLASRFLNSGGTVDELELQPWDENVQAVARYPNVLHWMDDNLEWTRQVGEAFLEQPEDVMDTIQRLRGYAHSLGNLQTTAQQIVEADSEGIDILPSDPDLFYLPTYVPTEVYLPRSGPKLGPFVSFGASYRTGSWLRRDWDWSNRRVVTWSPQQFRPRTWWAQPRGQRFSETTQFHEWHPRGGEGRSKWWASRRRHDSSFAHSPQQSQTRYISTASRSYGARSQGSQSRASQPKPAASH